MNEKSLKELNLTEDQLMKFKELEHKETALRSALRRCKVSNMAIDKIVAKSDVSKVDTDNIGALEEDIKEMWKDFIYD